MIEVSVGGGNKLSLETALAVEDDGEVDVDDYDEEMPVIQLEEHHQENNFDDVSRDAREGQTTQVLLVDHHDSFEKMDVPQELPMASPIPGQQAGFRDPSGSIYVDDDEDANSQVEDQPQIQPVNSRDLLPEEERPSIIGIMILPIPDTHLGIRLMSDMDGVVSRILPNSLLSNSPLRTGDRIISVNGKQCEGMTSLQIGSLIKTYIQMGAYAEQQYLNMVAYNGQAHPESCSADVVESMITKSNPDDILGIRMINFAGMVRISDIEPHGLVGHSVLNVYDTILRVNGISCVGKTSQAVVDIMREAPQYVTIVARAGPNTAVVLAEVNTTTTTTTTTTAAANGAVNRIIEGNMTRTPYSSSISRHQSSSPSFRDMKFFKVAVPLFTVLAIMLVALLAFQDNNDTRSSFVSWPIVRPEYKRHTAGSFVEQSTT